MSDRCAAEKAEGYRSPPNNLEAEQALLGALPIDNDALHLAATFLEADHFFLPIHGPIYDAVMHFVGRQEIANPVTLRVYFENDEALNEAGGAQYLARLAGSAVTVINAEHYGRAIHDLYVRQGLIHLAEEMQDAYDAPITHRRAIRTTNVLERPFVEERGRLKIMPNAFGETPVFRLMFGATIRAAERWRPSGSARSSVVTCAPQERSSIANTRPGTASIRRPQTPHSRSKHPAPLEPDLPCVPIISDA